MIKGVVMMGSNISTVLIKERPLRHDNGVELNDYELSKEALKYIDKYQAEHKEPVKMSPRFVEWLKDGIKFVDSGSGTFADYKKQTVLKQFDYDLIIENTNKLNQKLEKKGEFNAVEMNRIDRRSKK